MNSENDLEYLGLDKPEISPTSEETKVLWRRFLETDLSGRRVSFGSRGGNMGRIDAVIEKVHKIPGRGIALEIREATFTEEGEGVVKKPEPLDIKRFILYEDEPPRFSPGKAIVLPGGANYFEDSKSAQFEYGETLDIGIIY